jgi:glutamyl-tRNA synthetase
VNFLVLLGWSTPDNREIFSPGELVEVFSLEGINRANSVFDLRKGDPKFFTDPKAISINAHYIRTMALEELLPHVEAELKAAGLWNHAWGGERRSWFAATVDLIRSRYHTLKDFATLGRCYFGDDFPIEGESFAKNVARHVGLRQWLPLLADRLERLDDFTPQSIEGIVRGLAAEMGTKAGILINGARIVVTGQAAGPGLFDVLAAVGRERVVARLRDTDSLFSGKGR